MGFLNRRHNSVSVNAARLVVGLITTLLLVSMVANTARADHADIEISIPIDTVVRAEGGSITQLATVEVREGFVGHSCEVTAHAENQESVHDDNDLLVQSGTSSVTLADVESEPNRVTEAQQDLLLADVITVSLVMGPDKVFSAGIDVVVECFSEETTTTTMATTTTAEVSDTEVTSTEATTTTVEATTTTAEVSDTEVPTTEGATTSSIEDEVMGTEVLPFTGPESSQIGLLAIALVASGLLLVVGTRRADD